MINALTSKINKNSWNIRRFVTIAFFALVNVNFIYSQIITVTSPNGGETWRNGTVHDITWTNTETIDNVNIEISTDGGSNFTSVAGPISNTNSYTWTIPNLNEPDVRIKVSDPVSSANDISDANFRIISPNITNSPVKILPIGNSITLDYTATEFRYAQNRISYRYYLWNLLRNGNYNIDFIGHRPGGYAHFPDPENEGIPGINISDTRTFLQTGLDNFSGQQVTQTNLEVPKYLNAYPPDIVLIHIGTNNIGGDITTVVNSISDLIGDIETYDASHNNNIWIVLALIIQNYDQYNNPSQWVTDFDNALYTMAQGRIASGERILVVDMGNALNGSDFLADGLHPNESGKEKMANAWFPALQLVLPVSSLANPSINTTAPTVAYVGLPYHYDVNVTNTTIAPDYSLLTTAPSEMVINQRTGKIYWTPSSTATGSNVVTVAATDPTNSTYTSSQSFTIYVFPQPTLHTNLVSYWRMGKYVNTGFSQNTFNDFSGINDGNSNIDLTAVQGISGYGIEFNGNDINSNKSIKVLDDSTLYFSSSESFSIETWVKTTNPTGAFVGNYVGSGTKYYLGIEGGYAKFLVRDNSGEVQTTYTGFIINNGSWHHVVGVFDRSSNQARVYVDGSTNVNSVSSSLSGSFVSREPLTIGSFGNANFFNGTLDEIAIYKGVLTTTEIDNHYNRGNTYAEGYFDINARIKVFLQGPYSAGTMNTTLNPSLIPLSQPYNTAPWNYYGDEKVSSGFFASNTSIVDWVLVQLRTATTPGNPSTATNVVAQRAAFLKSTGDIVDLDGTSPVDFIGISPGDYYIVIKHRNHLAVISASEVTLPNSLTYDFTVNSSAYGTNPMVDLGGSVFGMFAGDVNGDGIIKYSDLNNDRLQILIALGFIQTSSINGYYSEDVNMDGVVKYSDIDNDRLMILNNLGFIQTSSKSTQVPN